MIISNLCFYLLKTTFYSV